MSSASAGIPYWATRGATYPAILRQVQMNVTIAVVASQLPIDRCSRTNLLSRVPTGKMSSELQNFSRVGLGKCMDLHPEARSSLVSFLKQVTNTRLGWSVRNWHFFSVTPSLQIGAHATSEYAMHGPFANCGILTSAAQPWPWRAELYAPWCID